jgi:hypothetical protein
MLIMKRFQRKLTNLKTQNPNNNRMTREDMGRMDQLIPHSYPIRKEINN